MNKKKITVAINENVNNTQYIEFLSKRYEITTVNPMKYNGEHIDLVLFIGGEDINPQYYNESSGMYTSVNNKRDNYEKDYLFNNFKKVPKLGICRGSQALTVWSGGRLIQHVEGHAVAGTHHIEVNNNYLNGTYEITSTHHQMMFPYNLDPERYNIIGYSKFFLSGIYWNGSNENIELPKNFVEPEIIYYNNTQSLCIQGHPESSNCPELTKDLILDLINYYLKV